MTLLQPLPPLWLGLWIPLLALAWLLPNHYYPWATFHSDAWVAAMLSLASAATFLRVNSKVTWHGLTVIVGLLALVPFAQFFTGLVHFSGLAWVCTAYVLGLLLALLTGAHWEKATPCRAADGLLLAIGIAALVSVGLQLRQWLGISLDYDEFQIWAAEYSPGRPAANLGQPNQLATLLLWGLMAFSWGVARRQIRPGYAVVMAMVLLFGLALTQSRIAIVTLLVFTLAAWGWRRLSSNAGLPWVVTALFFYFILCTVSLQSLSDLLGLGLEIRAPAMGGASTNLRLQAYSLFLDAIWRQPWFGYGWDQLAVAQFAVAQDHPNITSLFLQSHNLFIDLMVWCGIPIGGGMCIALMAWLFQAIRKTATARDAILLLFLVSVALHAMVEFPLHHAYFLLPAGLVMGVLNQRHQLWVVGRSGRVPAIFLWITTALLFGVIVRDYLRVDESFRVYRLEKARIGRAEPGRPPDVLLLNDLEAFIRNGRTEPHGGMSAKDLELLSRITLRYPSASNMFNYAKALALNGKPRDAEVWIDKMQHVQPDGYSLDLKAIWASQAAAETAMAAVKWPELPQKNRLAEQATQEK